MSLRVGLVSSAYRPFPSGVGEHVHHLAATLRDQRHEVSLLTAGYRGVGADPAGVTRLGRTLILPGNRSRFTLPVGLRLSGQVRDYLRSHQFDIVHCHGIFPPELAYWAAVHSHAPVVVTFHTFGLRLPGIVPAGFRGLFKGLRNRVRARIAVSDAGHRWAREWFPGEYHIIPNGVDTTRFRPDAPVPAGAAACRPYLLFVGRLEERKGLDVLLRALPAVRRHHPGIRLVVVGSGPLESRYRRLTERLAITESVQFVGRVSGDELPGWYAGSELYVSPALGGEAMGIVLIEAMASGTAVVASRIPGYDEVITDGRNGLLVRPGDARSLAETVSELLADPARHQALADTGRTRSRQYAWPEIAARIEAVYREVLD